MLLRHHGTPNLEIVLKNRVLQCGMIAGYEKEYGREVFDRLQASYLRMTSKLAKRMCGEELHLLPGEALTDEYLADQYAYTHYDQDSGEYKENVRNLFVWCIEDMAVPSSFATKRGCTSDSAVIQVELDEAIVRKGMNYPHLALVPCDIASDKFVRIYAHDVEAAFRSMRRYGYDLPVEQLTVQTVDGPRPSNQIER